MRERSLGRGRQRFISGNHQYGWLALGCVMAIFGVIFAVTAFTLSDPPRRVGFAVLFLALAGLSVQFSRASVVVDRAAEVVRLRGLVKTVAVPLADVAGFDAYLRLGGTGGGRRCVQLRRRDGSAIWCRGLTATRAGDALRMASRMNEAIGLGRQTVVPAARIADDGQAIAEFAQSMGKSPGTLSPSEMQVFDSERQLWLSSHGDTQPGQLA